MSQFLKDLNKAKDLNKHFSKGDTQMANKHMKNAQCHLLLGQITLESSLAIP